ncbi:MAG: glutaminyl-peptide cyclotransferase [Solirubrobacteraceae bacterium]|nr:glutaminyl-peptide cyclotransferase [Solirubrobacteraceae bacterium]
MRVLVVALVLQVFVAGAFIALAATDFSVFRGGGSGGGPQASVDRFDGPRAFRELRAQVALGPRPAGSAASRRLAERLRAELPAGAFEAVPGGLRNVVGALPGREPAILVAAHYDTKDLPGFVGANDGAGGTAAVMELARALGRSGARGDRAVRFALFDGEESPRGSRAFLRDGLRGSRAYARAHAGRLREVVVVDFVADRRLSLPRERNSDPGLWARLRAAARRVGVGGVFPDRVRGPIEDDHTPFAAAGLPAIDLIDFDYASFHTRGDDLSAVSERSLDAAGEALVELLRSERRQ